MWQGADGSDVHRAQEGIVKSLVPHRPSITHRQCHKTDDSTPESSYTSTVVSSEAEGEKDKAWESLCRAEGWVCRICGAVPERGQQFTDNLCDDCRKIARNE